MTYNFAIFPFSYGGQSTIATILDGASQRFSTIELVNKFEEFINKHTKDFVLIQKSLDTSLRIAKYELGWYDSYSPSMIWWLQAYDYAKYRLPTNIKPKEYVISVTPFFEDRDSIVKGSVTIEAEVMNSTNQIILHSSEMKIHDINVMVNEKKVNVLKGKEVSRYDQYVIYLAEPLPAKASLMIILKYTSNLNATELRGFYKSSYVNEKGETR